MAMNTTNGKLFGIMEHKNGIRRKVHLLFMFCYPQSSTSYLFLSSQRTNTNTRIYGTWETHPVYNVCAYICMHACMCAGKKGAKIYLVQTTTVTHLKARARRARNRFRFGFTRVFARFASSLKNRIAHRISKTQITRTQRTQLNRIRNAPHKMVAAKSTSQ